MQLATTNWEQMPYFLAVARFGSLRAAADALGTTHAKLSRHINALEAPYGLQLFRRSRGGVQLTEAGKLLLPIAKEAEGLFLVGGAQELVPVADHDPLPRPRAGRVDGVRPPVVGSGTGRWETTDGDGDGPEGLQLGGADEGYDLLQVPVQPS